MAETARTIAVMLAVLSHGSVSFHLKSHVSELIVIMGCMTRAAADIAKVLQALSWRLQFNNEMALDSGVVSYSDQIGTQASM